MDFPKINLHIHSNFSDGENSISQIVKVSLKLGLDYIAITDHFSNSWKAREIPTLNSYKKIALYLECLEECQKFLSESGKNLVLLRGLEVDLTSSLKYVKNLISPKNFNLILFEYLEAPESISYIENLIGYWRNKTKETELPLFGLAHFDPSHFIYGGLDVLIRFLEKYQIHFEFNSSYSEYYSRKNELFFEKLKDSKIPVAIGCDSHSLRTLNDFDEPVEMIKHYGLETNYSLFIKKMKTIEMP